MKDPGIPDPCPHRSGQDRGEFLRPDRGAVELSGVPGSEYGRPGEYPRGLPRIGPKYTRPRSARPRRKINERQSAQFCHLAHCCPIAVCAVQAVSESSSTKLFAGHLGFAASDRGRPGSCARRRDIAARQTHRCGQCRCSLSDSARCALRRSSTPLASRKLSLSTWKLEISRDGADRNSR